MRITGRMKFGSGPKFAARAFPVDAPHPWGSNAECIASPDVGPGRILSYDFAASGDGALAVYVCRQLAGLPLIEGVDAEDSIIVVLRIESHLDADGFRIGVVHFREIGEGDVAGDLRVSVAVALPNTSDSPLCEIFCCREGLFASRVGSDVDVVPVASRPAISTNCSGEV